MGNEPAERVAKLRTFWQEITANPLFGAYQHITIDGEGGDDYLRVDPALVGQQPSGQAARYVIRGGAGDDRIKLATTDDDDPSKPNATLYTYAGVVLEGGDGNDTIFGHTGVESIDGGAGE